MTVARAINCFDRVITVSRFEPGYYNEDGRFVAASPITFDIRASVQPARPDEIQRLPEGRRTSATIAVYSKAELKTANAPQGNQPDLLSYRKESFQVESVEDWFELGGYYKALAVKVGQ